MFRQRLSTFLILAALGLGACAPAAAPGPTAAPPTPPPSALPAPASNLTEGCVQQYDAAVDYFPEKTTLTHTDGFSVEYFNHYKVVTVHTVWPGAAEPWQYVLVQCGTPAPDGFSPGQVISVPARRLATMSTSYLPFVERLGLLDRLVAVDDTTYVSNPAVLQLAADGRLQSIGYGAGVNVEVLLDLQPDLIMTYGSGAPDYDAHPKLIEAGLPVALNAEWLENSPLARAEWGKFIALFFNREAAAGALFAGTAERYAALQRLAASAPDKPIVITGTPYEGVWYMPGGRSFAAQFLYDAGAAYPWADDQSTGSLPLDFESVFDTGAQAEVWLNLGFVTSLADLRAADPRFADFAAYRSGSVWNNDARMSPGGGNDYYETAVAEPDVVLADLIAILHPGLLPDHVLAYYRQVK